MSPVLNPLFRAPNTASSILLAAFSSPSPYFRSIAALRMVANGFALSCKIQRKVLLFIFGIYRSSFDIGEEKLCLFEEYRVRTCPAISGAEPCIGSKSPGPCYKQHAFFCSDVIIYIAVRLKIRLLYTIPSH